MGLTPLANEKPGVAEFLTGLIGTQINPALAHALQEMGTACAETVVLLDTFDHLNQVHADPEAFGLTNVTDACLLSDNADCSEYLFWDQIHPTTAASSILADLFRADFCGTGDRHPGLRGIPITQPPPIWRGVCYGSQ